MHARWNTRVFPPLWLELKLEMEVGGWRTGMLGTAIAKAEQSMKMKEEEWQHKARLLYVVWVALKLCPETPGGCDWA